METAFLVLFWIILGAIILIAVSVFFAISAILRSFTSPSLGPNEKVKTDEDAVAILSNNTKKTSFKNKR
jgi:hypothetical protein